MMRDAIVFGEHQNLVGVLTQPEGYPSSSTGVLMLTAGMLSSSGPYRLHTRLADRLAGSGISSLRFDLSGIGESLGIGAAGSSLARASHEVSAGIDQLQQSIGCDRVVLFGLCSGADDALQAALDDERVDGLVLVDGCGYPTKRFQRRRIWSHYGYRLFQGVTWRRKLRALLGKSTAPDSMPMGLDIREFPDRETATKTFQTLVDRGVRFQFFYTGGVADYYNYADQIWEMLPGVDWNQQASAEYFPAMDHTAMLCEDRLELVDSVVQAIRGMIPSEQMGDELMSMMDDTLPMETPPVASTSPPCFPLITMDPGPNQTTSQ